MLTLTVFSLSFFAEAREFSRDGGPLLLPETHPAGSDADVSSGFPAAHEVRLVFQYSHVHVQMCFFFPFPHWGKCCHALACIWMKQLKAVCTPWGHVWSVHVPRMGAKNSKHFPPFILFPATSS